MEKRKNAFVVLAIDGISTIHSGVGTIVYSFIEAYDEIKSEPAKGSVFTFELRSFGCLKNIDAVFYWPF